MYPEHGNITQRVTNPLGAQTTCLRQGYGGQAGLCSKQLGGLLERHVAIVVAMDQEQVGERQCATP